MLLADCDTCYIHTAAAPATEAAEATLRKSISVYIIRWYFFFAFVSFLSVFIFASFINIISQQSHNVFSIKKSIIQNVVCVYKYADTNHAHTSNNAFCV